MRRHRGRSEATRRGCRDAGERLRHGSQVSPLCAESAPQNRRHVHAIICARGLRSSCLLLPGLEGPSAAGAHRRGGLRHRGKEVQMVLRRIDDSSQGSHVSARQKTFRLFIPLKKQSQQAINTIL